MDYKWAILSKLGRFKNFKLNSSSYRIFYGLSEKHKIIEIGSSELKLQGLKLNLDVQCS